MFDDSNRPPPTLDRTCSFKGIFQDMDGWFRPPKYDACPENVSDITVEHSHSSKEKMEV